MKIVLPYHKKGFLHKLGLDRLLHELGWIRQMEKIENLKYKLVKAVFFDNALLKNNWK